jgi:hypothetical protein
MCFKTFVASPPAPKPAGNAALIIRVLRQLAVPRPPAVRRRRHDDRGHGARDHADGDSDLARCLRPSRRVTLTLSRRAVPDRPALRSPRDPDVGQDLLGPGRLSLRWVRLVPCLPRRNSWSLWGELCLSFGLGEDSVRRKSPESLVPTRLPLADGRMDR